MKRVDGPATNETANQQTDPHHKDPVTLDPSGIPSPGSDLNCEALVIRELGATVLDATDIGTYAIEYALHGWPVFPLRGKVPAIRSAHPVGSPEYGKCRGECGQFGHGLYDASTDLAVIATWWGGRYAGCNVGGRVPDPMVMVDVDPYKGGLDSLAALENKHGELPVTLTDLSGRGDGGVHYWFRRPPGRLTDSRLGAGIDIKTSAGYGVLPPSLHPDTGRPYARIEAPVAAPPDWLSRLLRADQPSPAKQFSTTAITTRSSLATFFTGSVADDFCATTSWSQILAPHGWTCDSHDPEADGARWRHPTATAAWSATIRHGCLFVYSTNTPFDVTEPGNPKGYTRFRAYAVLEHAGDLKAAARALSGKGVV